MFTRKEFRRLNKFKRIYILASGGRDSTYAILKLMEFQYWITKPVTILFTDTGNETTSALITLEKLYQAVTAHNLELPPSKKWSHLCLATKAILPKKPVFYIKKAFMKIPKAKQILLETPDRYSKKIFPCCYYLKHRVFDLWIRENGFQSDPYKGVFASCIRPGESLYRRRWLKTLRDKKLHFWFIRRSKVWYYYPLRDIMVRDVNELFLQSKKFLDTKHSGCQICPILVLFNIKSEGKRYSRSLRVYENMVRRGLIKETSDIYF